MLFYVGSTQDILLDNELLRKDFSSYKSSQKKVTMNLFNEDVSIIYEDRQLKKKEDFSEQITTNPIYESLKEHIYIISKQYIVPYDIMTTIGHQESGGDWNTNGVISYTGDYGQFQINLRWNFEDINRDLGFTADDLLNDPYKNIEASAYLLQKIMHLYGYTMDNFDYENIFGTYNGWKNWRNSSMARNYVSSCMAILAQNLYPYY